MPALLIYDSCGSVPLRSYILTDPAAIAAAKAANNLYFSYDDTTPDADYLLDHLAGKAYVEDLSTLDPTTLSAIYILGFVP
jgi:hypothetical protein